MSITEQEFAKLVDMYAELVRRYSSLLKDWNHLVGQINAKGGEAFLDSKIQFTAQEMRQLAILCHPDKHGNSEVSVKLTKKIMELRK